MYDEPIVITLKTGEIYAGLVDECFYNGGLIVALYSCRLLDKTSQTWIDHDIFTTFEGREIRDTLPEFWVSDIKRVEVLTEDLQDNVDLEDALQFYIDPHYMPLPHVECNWGKNPDRKHSVDCEAHLHEALTILRTQSEESVLSSKEDTRSLQAEIDQSFAFVRRRLLVLGARIP